MNPLFISAIYNASVKAGVSATLLLSICINETGLKNSTNRTDPHGGSHGICQINGINTKDVAELYNPNFSALVAATYLKRLTNRYPMWEAVSVYSVGNNRWYNEAYVNKVKRIYTTLKKKGRYICVNRRI